MTTTSQSNPRRPHPGRRENDNGSRSRSSGTQRIDWNKFTNFRSRNTRKDLDRLLDEQAARGKTRKKELLEQADQTGLIPIHWAAINNRSDMIESLYEAGSALAKPCRNRLFANGTPLHLAAMNGSLEAAAMLLNKSHELQSHKTRPKSLGSSGRTSEGEFESQNNDHNNNNNSNDNDNDDATRQLLEARDSEGQTPLMRTAAPRSKRLDAIRDLLRKNFWSLSGRPAEMALLLICLGSDWRQTEPQNGMNLLHLAIVNDYDDIVSLVLVLDKNLIDTPTLRAGARRQRPRSSDPTDEKGRDVQATPKEDANTPAGFRTVTLGPPETSPSSTATSRTATPSSSQTTSTSPEVSADENSSDASSVGSTSEQDRPLIGSRQDRANELLAAGLKPLQLAILYGRVSMISQLWQLAKPPRKPPGQRDHSERRPAPRAGGAPSQVDIQQEALRDYRQSGDQRQLKRILIRACYSNKQELAKFLKPALLKGALVLDLALLALVWAPAYMTLSGFAGGLFMVSYVLAMALALRVVLKNPGYLRRNSVQYLSELAKLLESRRRDASREADVTPATDEQASQVRQRRKSTAPLIKLEPTSENERPPASGQTDDRKQEQASKAAPVVSVTSVPAPVDAFRDLQDKVRLFCHKCQCIRRPRSRHCNSCNHCVQDFDHHCIYLGACVGRHNRLDFLLAMVALAITGLYGATLQSALMAGGDASSNFVRLLGLVWVSKYALIGGFAAFLNLRRACIGVTLYEEVRSKRIRRTFGRSGPPGEIAKSHRAFATSLKDSFWRYAPDRFLTGDLAARRILGNLREFSNYLAPDEYLLTFLCTDTPLARSLTSSDLRVKQLYKFV